MLGACLKSTDDNQDCLFQHGKQTRGETGVQSRQPPTAISSTAYSSAFHLAFFFVQ